MKKVMVRAWEIARQGQAKFGGKVKEYFAQALKMAWAETRKVVINTTHGSRKHKSWVARITGKDARFGFAREFVDPVSSCSWDGKEFELNNGIYEVCDGGERKYIKVVNGQIINLRKSEVAA
ncbi:hypothetical protein [Virgibacillus pantothenticus]|uniref:hypothetical protein n=1 Tax=Virgibacillus pantothenticus TaxID=1473 RepID=UPI0009868C42|nr:hypothetical protein [Virgibacillus pantothenticus]